MSGVTWRRQRGSSTQLMKLWHGICAIVDDWMSCSIDDVEVEEVEVCAAAHGAFNQLQSVNVPFDWSVAPGLLKCG